MEHEVWWREREDVLHVKIAGPLNPDEVVALGALMRAILDTKARPRILFEYTEDIGVLSRETRVALQKVLPDIKAERMAAFGLSNLNRIIARIVVRLTGRADQTRFFETQAPALAWLGEDAETSGEA